MTMSLLYSNGLHTVNTKRTRTWCIIFFLWSEPKNPRQPNYKCEHTRTPLHYWQ